MADLLLLQYIVDRALQREQIFYDHADLFAERDDNLFGCFRLLRAVLMDFCNHLEPAQQSQTQRSNHMCGLSRPWAFWPLEHLSGSWETGRTYNSRPSATLPQAVDAINQLAT